MAFVQIMMILFCSLLLLLFAAPEALGITFYLPVDSTKCIREEVHKDVLVVGEYQLSDAAFMRTDILVSSIHCYVVYSTEW